jgi:FHS family L-fucose permease-like MFS transporter
MSNQKSTYIMSLLIIGMLFFTIGFATWVNGTLIPYLKIACELETEMQSYLVATAFFIAYTLMALPSSFILGKIGYKKGMSLSLVVMALGAILFVPAASVRSFELFLVGLFIIGSGLALLQTAVNPYVSIIGPLESAATRISIMGISNKVAGILAGLIFGYITLSDADALEASLISIEMTEKAQTLDELASRVVVPYYIISGVLVLLALIILRSPLPEIDDSQAEEGQEQEQVSGRKNVFQYPHLLLGVLALFFYVGVEVIAGDTIISYGKSLGISLSTARYFTQGTLACMLVGYLIGIVTIPKYISQSRALSICAVLGVIFSILALITEGFTSVLFIALLGLANSLMWPAIFPLSINKLGSLTKTGSAMLIMAISGGAILPLVYGWLADAYDGQGAYLMMVPCYLFILFFAIKGHKIGLKG